MPEDESLPEKVSSADMEFKVRTAMVSRVPYFKDQADSLTFEGVRRLLEKDLGLDTFALDVHKRFVKQCLQECLESGNEDEGAKDTEDAEMTISSVDGQSEDKDEQKKEPEEPNSKDGMEESPVMGLMAGKEKSKSETQTIEDAENHTAPTEAMIKKAISKRASHFRNNSENITMVGVRRLLEEDLKLDKFALDPFKKLVSEQVNEVLTHTEVAKSATSDKKGAVKKRMPKKSREAESSGASSESGSKVDEDEVKPRRKSTPKGKTQSLSGLKKRKRSEKDVKPKRKEAKATEDKSEESSEAEGSGDGSEEEKTESSAERSAKRKEVPKPSYGKRVEKMKSVVKSCGLSIPPSIYKKAKDAPENKREATLIKELENILAKEGLSANPSEKEIKEVKKRKETAKELEGIDMSNIVSSSRRRSTLSFVPPPKPKIPESDADSGDSEDDDGDDEDEEQDEDEDGASKSEEDEGDDNGDSD